MLPTPSVVAWGGSTRWARASSRTGHFCRHEDHARFDYDQGPRTHEDSSGRRVELSGRACGICYPKALWQKERATEEGGDVPF